jgi:glutaredoxin-like protein NrdH
MTITLLSKPGCVPCLATKRAFDSKGLEYEERDMSVDAEALDMAKSLGHMAAPVVIITETGENWSGFRPERIAALSV